MPRDELQIRHGKLEQCDLLRGCKEVLLVAADPNVDLEDDTYELVEGEASVASNSRLHLNRDVLD